MWQTLLDRRQAEWAAEMRQARGEAAALESQLAEAQERATRHRVWAKEQMQRLTAQLTEQTEAATRLKRNLRDALIANESCAAELDLKSMLLDLAKEKIITEARGRVKENQRDEMERHVKQSEDLESRASASHDLKANWPLLLLASTPRLYSRSTSPLEGLLAMATPQEFEAGEEEAQGGSKAVHVLTEAEREEGRQGHILEEAWVRPMHPSIKFISPADKSLQSSGPRPRTFGATQIPTEVLHRNRIARDRIKSGLVSAIGAPSGRASEEEEEEVVTRLIEEKMELQLQVSCLEETLRLREADSRTDKETLRERP